MGYGRKPQLAAVACVLILLSGCTQDDHPSATQGGDEVATPTPEATPSPTPIEAVAIKPQFVFKGEVAPGTRRTIKRATRRAFSLFKIPMPDGEPVERYVEVYGDASPYDSETTTCGETTDAGGLRIYVPACAQEGSVLLIETVVHEAFHALQQLVMETHNVGLGVHIDGDLPRWFSEGSASVAAATALDRWGLKDYAESRDEAVEWAMLAESDLRKLKASRTWNKPVVDQQIAQYGLSFLAVERITERDWKAALEVYRRAVSHRVIRWGQAFEATFGVTEREFYRQFARYRENGFER